MNTPVHGFCRTVAKAGDRPFASSATERIAGVRTIQQPPGAGTPVKKCVQYGAVSCSSIVLKRASRKQSHIAGPPVIQKYMNIAGATPKFTKSASESSSAPSFELAFRSRAILPSIPSQMQATSSARRASRKRPSDDREIDVIPAHAASDVTRFGTTARSGTRSGRGSRGRRRRPLRRKRLTAPA